MTSQGGSFNLGGIAVDSTSTSSSVCASRMAGNLETNWCTSHAITGAQPKQRIALRFAPTAAGAHSAALTFTPDPATGLAAVTLTLDGAGL